MSREPVHIIERQVLDLTVAASHAEAVAVQERIRRLYSERLEALIDGVFTQAVGPETVIRFDRLEVDLGHVGGSSFEAALAEALESALKEILTDRLPKDEPSPDETVVWRGTVRQSRMEGLVAFLRTGTLPWWQGDPMAFDPDAVLLALLDEIPTAAAERLRRVDAAPVRARLVRQMTPDVLERLIAALIPTEAGALVAVRAEWEQVLADFSETDGLITALMSQEIALAVALRAPDPVAAFHAGIIERLDATIPTDQTAEPLPLVVRLAKHAAHVLDADAPTVRWLQARSASKQPSASRRDANTGRSREDEHVRAGGTATGASTSTNGTGGDQPPVPGERAAPREVNGSVGRPPSGADEVSESIGTSLGAPQSRRQDAASPAPEQMGLDTAADSDAVRYYIGNAGLALVAPFLGQFFKHLGFVEGAAFVDEGAQHRAVLLTQVLVTGHADHPEPVLVFNKVLCGWPLAVPVDRTIDLTEAEHAACDDFLTSVVAQWPALKKTSAAGFRAAFLQREGRLERQDTNYTLYVERTAYDVLLDTLPWGIGLLKHPWMDRPVYLEW